MKELFEDYRDGAGPAYDEMFDGDAMRGPYESIAASAWIPVPPPGLTIEPLAEAAAQGRCWLPPAARPGCCCSAKKRFAADAGWVAHRAMRGD